MLKSKIEYDYPLLKVLQSIPETRTSITLMQNKVVNPYDMTKDAEY